MPCYGSKVSNDFSLPRVTVQTTEVTLKAVHRLTPSLLSCFLASLFCYTNPSLKSCRPFTILHIFLWLPQLCTSPPLVLEFITHPFQFYFPQSTQMPTPPWNHFATQLTGISWVFFPFHESRSTFLLFSSALNTPHCLYPFLIGIY